MHATFIFHSSVGLVSIRSPTLTPVNQIISLLFLHIRSDCSNWPSERSETMHDIDKWNCNLAECNLLNHKGCDLFKQKVYLLYLIIGNQSMAFKKNIAIDKHVSSVSTKGLMAEPDRLSTHVNIMILRWRQVRFAVAFKTYIL